MSRTQLIEMATQNIAYAQSGAIKQAAGIGGVEVEHYYAPARWPCTLAARIRADMQAHAPGIAYYKCTKTGWGLGMTKRVMKE